MSINEPQSSEKLVQEHYPIADEFFKQETVERVNGLIEVTWQIRKKGGVPGTALYDIDYAAPLTPDMDAGYKQRLIEHQHKLFMQALRANELSIKLRELNPISIVWEDDGETINTLFTRLTSDIALAENTYVTDNGEPINYRPMFWTGKNALDSFVLDHTEGSAALSAYVG